MNCVMLDFDSSGHLTRAWGLTEAPAFAVIAPEGTVRASGSGRISKDQLLTALRESLAATTQPSP
jgi:hypothetical protein